MTYADEERLGDEIAELAAHLDAATHRLLALIARFDESGGWADQGALTCAHWLCGRVGLELGAAREHVRVAKALRDLPHIDEALRVGRLSYSKVRALTRVATAENEDELLAMGFASTASQLERICRGYRRALRNMGEQIWRTRRTSAGSAAGRPTAASCASTCSCVPTRRRSSLAPSKWRCPVRGAPATFPRERRSRACGEPMRSSRWRGVSCGSFGCGCRAARRGGRPRRGLGWRRNARRRHGDLAGDEPTA